MNQDRTDRANLRLVKGFTKRFMRRNPQGVVTVLADPNPEGDDMRYVVGVGNGMAQATLAFAHLEKLLDMPDAIPHEALRDVAKSLLGLAHKAVDSYNGAPKPDRRLKEWNIV